MSKPRNKKNDKTKYGVEGECNENRSNTTNLGRRAPNSRRRSGGDRQDTLKDVYKTESNDIRWYAQNPQILKDTASFAYGYPTGSKLNLGEYGQYVNDTSVPGVVALYTLPTVGVSEDYNSPVNLISRNLFTFVRHANSGMSNYDAPDLMLYLLAMDGAYSYLAWMKRIYGVMSVSNRVNRYYPRSVIEAMRVNYDSVNDNLANFRAFINMYAVKLAAMAIPSNMSYMARHQWMYSGLYLDAPSAKAQTYLFSPLGFYKFMLDDQGAGMCALSSMNQDSLWTVEDIERYANSLIDPILGNQDFNIMSGDIMKAFGSNIYRAEGISETYSVLPVYDETVLSQIQNTTLIGDPIYNNGYYSAFNVTQSDGKSFLYSKPQTNIVDYYRIMSTTGTLSATVKSQIKVGANIYAMNKLINSRKDNPEPADTMEATRLSVFGEYVVGDSATTLTLTACGADVVCFMNIYYWGYDLAGGKTWTLLNTGRICSILPTYNLIGADQEATTLRTISQSQLERLKTFGMLTQFDWAPHIYPAIINAGIDTSGHTLNTSYGQSLASPYYMGDIDNYTVISSSAMNMMHEAALLSMFGVGSY